MLYIIHYVFFRRVLISHLLCVQWIFFPQVTTAELRLKYEQIGQIDSISFRGDCSFSSCVSSVCGVRRKNSLRVFEKKLVFHAHLQGCFIQISAEFHFHKSTSVGKILQILKN